MVRLKAVCRLVLLVLMMIMLHRRLATGQVDTGPCCRASGAGSWVVLLGFECDV